MGDLYLNRELMSSWVYTDRSSFSKWIYLVQLSWHEPTKILIRGELYDVPQGCAAVDIKKLAEMWKIKKNNVLQFLSLLIEDEIATVNILDGIAFVNMLSRYVRIY